MRTIASTFDNREEAETASRRLQDIGVPRDRIVLKYVDDPNGGSVFLSVKASPEQVGPATDILKRQPAAAPLGEPAAPAAATPTAAAPAAAPPPSPTPEPAFAAPNAREQGRPAAAAPARKGSSFGETSLYLVGLLAIFFIGWLIGSSI